MKVFCRPQAGIKKHKDLSKTKEKLHVVESMVKVERFLTYEKNIKKMKFVAVIFNVKKNFVLLAKE